MSTDEDLYFEPNPRSPTRAKNNTTALRSLYTKPIDDFTAPPLTEYTIFYLAVIAPHTDSYTLHGPVKDFPHLLPKIEQLVSNSPSAIDKLENLRNIEDVWGDVEENVDFQERGFQTFVIEGQRGIYTVLKILREENMDAFYELPSPVYTVTSHGPLVHAITSAGGTSFNTGAKGYAATSKLVGTRVDRKDAKKAAHKAMRELTEGHLDVKITENWEAGGKGAGVLMAMSTLETWEVKAAYEDQVHKRARDDVDREGEKRVGWRF
jgi:hypothetical protein